MSKEELYGLSEVDFINYIICTICDYAKHNNYQITDTVKTMGENLVAITEIAVFDNWEESESEWVRINIYRKKF